MRRNLLATVLFGVLLLFGTSPSFAQNLSGTYTVANPQGGTVTLTLQQDARGRLTGTLSANGQSLKVEGEVEDGEATGTMSGAAGSAIFTAALEGTQLELMLIELDGSGQPNMNAARQLVLTRQAPGAAAATATTPASTKAANKPPAGGTMPAPAPGVDAQLHQLFLSSAWCSFSYNKTSGATNTSRVVFTADGFVTQKSNYERSSSGDIRNSTGDVTSTWGVGSQSSGGQQARWRVLGGALNVSADGVQWQPVRTQVTRNSNGYPIVTADGVEYSQCR